MNAATGILVAGAGAGMGIGMDLLVDWPRTRKEDHDDARMELRLGALALAGAGVLTALSHVKGATPLGGAPAMVALGAGGLFLGESAGNVVQDRTWPRFSHVPGTPTDARDIAARSAGLGIIALGAAVALPAIAPRIPRALPLALQGLGAASLAVGAGAGVLHLAGRGGSPPRAAATSSAVAT